MKRRIRRIANFFAFNLLFFALYLNFIHKDKAIVGAPVEQTVQTATVGGAVPVTHPEKYLDLKSASTTTTNTPSQQ